MRMEGWSCGVDVSLSRERAALRSPWRHPARAVLGLIACSIPACGVSEPPAVSSAGDFSTATPDAGESDPQAGTEGFPADAGSGVEGSIFDAAVIPPVSVARPDAETSLCERKIISAQSIAPDVLIVLDKSLSMGAGLRWDPSRNAVDRLVREFDDQIKFGLSLFPAGQLGLCDPGRLDVPLALGNGDAIMARVNQELPFGITPTAQTLENALDYLGPRQVAIDGVGPPPAYVLLVTDGEPNCADLAHLDPLQSSVAAIEALHNANVKTFVIGYGLVLGALAMDRMAQAGGTEHYYAVENQQQLTEAFRAITSGLVSCTFELSEVPPDPKYVRVSIDGTTLELDAASGWVISGKVVTLQGAACATLRDGVPHDLESQVECEPVIVQ